MTNQEKLLNAIRKTLTELRAIGASIEVNDTESQQIFESIAQCHDSLKMSAVEVLNSGEQK